MNVRGDLFEVWSIGSAGYKINGSKQNKAVESNFPKEKSLKTGENGELYGLQAEFWNANYAR